MFMPGPRGPRGRRHRGEGPPHGGGPPFGRRGRRARRGDVRTALLVLLAERPMHGYEMLRELETRSGALWKPSPGSVYPTLQLLEDEGAIRGNEVDGRRTYSITDAGRTLLKGRQREQGSEPPWAHERDGKARDLREAGISVGEATLQAARVASDEQIERVLGILRDARRKIYAILAEGE